MKDNVKRYKVYHRNYQNIMELYDDLSDAILDIGLKNNRITIRYNSDTFEIEPCPGGYHTYLNGKRERGETEDKDIYFYAVEFVHEQRKGLTELEVNDTSIAAVTSDGITYFDEFERKHFVNYATCAGNGPSEHCVADRDITKWYIRFYTPQVPIKFVFSNLFVFKKGNRFLVGGRAKRFITLQQAIVDSRYTTYDLS